MDEDEFRKQFRKKSVFRQASSLDLSYVPEKLFCRDDTLKTLIFNYRRILEEAVQPTISCLILGKGGVGKTCTARFFGKTFRTIAIENDVNLFIEYFNCINFRSKSKIIRELLAKYQHGSGRGFSDDEALKLILSQLIRENGYMLLVIDEIHLLKPDDTLAFLNIAETFGHQNVKLSLLLISRSKDWMKIENERLIRRLEQKIVLEPYDFAESMQILKYRSELAFKENIVDDDHLAMISQVVVDHKNMAHGVEILRKSGSYCDKEGLDQISADIIREASNDVYPTFRNDIVDELKDHELLTLYGIVRALIRFDAPYILIDDAFEDYNLICESCLIEPHVKMSYRECIRQLTQLKIVTSKTVRIEEAIRERHLEITLLDIPTAPLERLLEDIIIKRVKRRNILNDLGIHERLILYIMKFSREVSYPPFYPLLKELYNEYKENCNVYGVFPLSRRKIKRKVLFLNNLGIMDIRLLLDKNYASLIDELYTSEDFKNLFRGIDKEPDNR